MNDGMRIGRMEADLTITSVYDFLDSNCQIRFHPPYPHSVKTTLFSFSKSNLTTLLS